MNKSNRLERLTFILIRLSKGYNLSTPSLVEYFQSTAKIIRTDFKDYILSYFSDDSIYYDYSSKAYIAKTNFLTSSVFSAEELAIMMILKNKTLDKYSDINLHNKTVNFFDKYKEVLKNDIYQTSSVEKLNKNDNIQKIKHSINTKHIINCTYNNKERIIYPLNILNIEGYWYLVNFDTTDNKLKTFHLNSIENIKINQKRYNYKNESFKKFNNCINAYFKPNAKSIFILLFIDKEIVKFFERKPLNSSQRIVTKYKNGSVDLEIFVSDFMEIIPTIQKYIPLIKVIEPKELDSKIRENLAKY